jgi:putative phosphotransacetylase
MLNMEGLVDAITKEISAMLSSGSFPIVVGVSNRHVHLSREHAEVLFGKGCELTKLRDLRQPGEFAAKETVTVATAGGVLESVRILGPIRKKTQFELSAADARKLRIDVPVIKSGSSYKLNNPVLLIGPKGSVSLTEGVGIAWRHIHLSPEEASILGVKDGQEVDVEAKGDRGVIFRKVWVRVSERFVSEFHVDVDEANACGLKTGDYVHIVRIPESL